MNSFLLIVLLSILLYNAYASQTYDYQLPDGDVVKSLKVTVNREMYKPVIHVFCNNYDSLKYLEIRPGPLPFFPYVLIELTFVGCFNNQTDNENHNYRLWDTISRMPNFSEHDLWFRIDLSLDQYTVMNSDVLLENFNFTKFRDINFENFGFNSSRYLAKLTCKYCMFVNIMNLDFNDVRNDLRVDHVKVLNSELINFNSENLKKFNAITVLQMYGFSLADINAFNVPRLFEHNGQISMFLLDGSKHKITLHEDVFRGLGEIRTLKLANLQLDYIPENLFIDLRKIQEILLNSNNIKTVHPNTFAHFQILTIRLNDNPIFTMAHDKIENLTIKSHNLYLGNFTSHTLNVIEALVNSAYIKNIKFETLLMDPIDVREFSKIHRNLDSYQTITFNAIKVGLDMEYIKLHSTPKLQPIDIYSRRRAEDLNAVVILPIKDSLCGDCWVIKQFLPNYFDNHENYPEFYFSQSRLLIKPQVSCARQKYRFEEKFEQNCPTECTCKYNGLLDKIVIDCNKRNFYEIPIIPYPEQFNNIVTIDLLFENNFITNLTFENQDSRVLEKVSTLKFRSNKLTSLYIPATLKARLQVLDLCGNNGLLSKEFDIAGGNFRYANGACIVGSQYPRSAALYFKQNKSQVEVAKYLEMLCPIN